MLKRKPYQERQRPHAINAASANNFFFGGLRGPEH
jgi:hypothetical protein